MAKRPSMNTVLVRFGLRTALAILVGAVFGLAIGELWAGVALALFLYGSWHSYYLYRLTRWLQDDVAHEVPRGVGLWGDVFYQFGRMRRINAERRRHLKDALLQYRRSIDALPDSAIVLDQYARIRFANEAAERMLGVSRSDAGQYLPNLIRHPDFGSYLQAGKFEKPLSLPSSNVGSTHLSVSVTEYGEGQQLVLVRDVSASTQLEQSRREFVANASHEVRTPLTVIIGYLETMAGDDDAAMEPWQGPIQHMREQAARMESILKDLLMLARLDSPWGLQNTNQPVDISELIDIAVADARQLSSEHTITLAIDDQLQLRGNSDELQSVVTNLVTNAIRHTPPGTAVAISWKRVGLGAVLSVADTGPGIPAEHLPRLAERFYRVDTSRSRHSGGTGLGLAIVSRLLERHDSRLDIDSELGRGTQFECRFPRGRLVPSAADDKSAEALTHDAVKDEVSPYRN